MTDNVTKIWGVSLSILAFSLAVSTASAQTCGEQPTCEELGYTQTTQYCQNMSASGNILKCPFDTEKVFCITNGTENCSIGSILYEDKKCHTSSNLTPIGVVFDTSKKLAVALNTSKLKYSTEYYNFNNGFHDPDHECDGAYLNTTAASGKDLTYAYIPVAKCIGVSLPAMEYCASYSTQGTSAGDWFLASRNELKTLVSNRSAVDATLTKLGHTKLSGLYIWTASESENAGDANEYAWVMLMNEDVDDTEDKQNTNTVVPVISY